MKIRKLCLLGLMTALCIVLAILEQQIPALPWFPPGVKLGLSNIAVMFTLFFIGLPGALLLAVCKALFVLLTRGLVSAALSLSGGLLSVLLMAILKKTRASYMLLSITGAIAHNLAQLLVCSLWLGTSFFSVYLPVLILSGALMGTLTGLTLLALFPALKRLSLTKEFFT